MHPKLCIVLILWAAVVVGGTLSQSTFSTSTSNEQKVNVVLESSCWTSDSCREGFKNRFNGRRVSTVQVRVPWELMHPTFNHSLIRNAVQHLLQSADPETVVEPLYIIKNQAEMDQLHRIAHDLTSLNLTRGAFLLDSTDAKENLAVITRELSIIHAVFGRRRSSASTKFYNIPPRSFLSTKHLHKYLSFVRKHVTGIRLQLSTHLENAGAAGGGSSQPLLLETLDDMLTVISNSSLVPEVETKNNAEHLDILQQLNHHHVTVFRSIASEDDLHLMMLMMMEEEQQQQQQQKPQSTVPPRRFPRSPGGGGDILNYNESDEEEAVAAAKHRQRQLLKLFPSMTGLRTPPLTWTERRLSAKRNLEKLFDKLGVAKIAATKPEVVRSSSSLAEEKIFLESENPRFPKENVAVSLIDRHRDDATAKDYDYVEFDDKPANLHHQLSRGVAGKKKKNVALFGDLSDEEESVVREQPKLRYAAAKPIAKDLELAEMESYLQSGKHRNVHHHLASQQQQQRQYSAVDGDEEEEDSLFFHPQHHRQHHRQQGPFIDDYEMAGHGRQPSVQHFYGEPTKQEEDDDEDDDRVGYGPYHVLNYTTDSSYYHPEQQQYGESRLHPASASSSSKRRKASRMTRRRRDIFSQLRGGGGGGNEGGSDAVAGVVQSLFQDIRDYYPSMLERLSEATDVLRARRDELTCKAPAASTSGENNHIENLLLDGGNEGFDGLARKVRRSSALGGNGSGGRGFIRRDPATNEIGYKPTPVTRRTTIAKKKPTPKSSPSSSVVGKPSSSMDIVTVLLDSWHIIKDQFMRFFA